MYKTIRLSLLKTQMGIARELRIGVEREAIGCANDMPVYYMYYNKVR